MSTTVESAPEGADHAWPSPAIGWGWVTILVLAYICSYVDRQILSLMVDRIKTDLDITDSQFGLLHGLSFAMLYSIAGLPLGSLIDRYPRRTIVIWGVMVWSVMTAVCGLARHFFQLFFARVGVGLGEATLSPSAYSLLADCFEPRKLGVALGVYFAGSGVGAGLAYMLGGSLIGMVDSMQPIQFAFLAGMKTWQIVFLVVALPGLPIALLMLTLAEPKRLGVRRAEPPKWGELLAYLVARRRFMVPFMLGMSCVAAVTLGGYSWFAAVMMRSFKMSPSEAGLELGMVMLVSIPMGLMITSWAAQRVEARGVRGANLLVSVITSVLMIGATSMIFVAHDKNTMLLAVFLTMAIGAAPVAIAAATLQSLMPNEMRGRASALMLLIQNGVGMVLGPFIPGLLTDHVFGGEPTMITPSLGITLVSFSVLATILLVIAYRHLRSPAGIAMTDG